MKPIYAFEGGLAGAVALTLVHEAVKRVIPKSPRLDLLGMQAISKAMGSETRRPHSNKVYAMAIAGDLVSNALYYSIAGIGGSKGAVLKGAALGLGAGLGAVFLPSTLDLNNDYTNRTPTTRLMTIGLYVLGGIVTSIVLKKLDDRKRKRQQNWQHKLLTSSQA